MITAVSPGIRAFYFYPFGKHKLIKPESLISTARAAELQRRLEETYGKRRGLKRVAAAARERIQETRARLQQQQEEDEPSAESDPAAAASSSAS
ncbi:hypothetical protein E2562_036763 [Oryza meyeriana var. granulata]|uniref:Uncharacterized protein n=1 Tax=Oryza meyeriana var. granulata TaxID=110450 RepID=A0A6G1DST2_9ORYZ|nr:hypothetical protein E2562_036763 [Oryza meyeriana var. granulata]